MILGGSNYFVSPGFFKIFCDFRNLGTVLRIFGILLRFHGFPNSNFHLFGWGIRIPYDDIV